ncbi:MAG: dehypoxanthine futalosine cyclase [Verrucomicrobia bacterium]|jgi:cyclic dehypoxanthinyl futalosine synthase|nr:dehypoxanthine futalosine cyclase [Verrucomicrobiota bacterium]
MVAPDAVQFVTGDLAGSRGRMAFVRLRALIMFQTSIHAPPSFFQRDSHAYPFDPGPLHLFRAAGWDRVPAVIYDASLDDLCQRVWEGHRIDCGEAQRLYALPLEELGALADRRRQLAKANAYEGRGNEIVTYNIDRNVNYTNVCNVYCKFCAFYRTEKDEDAYVITPQEMDRKIEETIALGGTQILLQGGHHPKLSKSWYLDLLSRIRTRFPQVNIHGFSPSEFIHFRDAFQEPLSALIAEFRQAGLGSIPGGGGEILVDRVRQRVAPLKAMSDDWLEVMDVAHAQGLFSSATMMFGHVETVADRIEHLDRLRVQQDRSLRRRQDSPGSGCGHFTAFIGWTFQSENTRLRAPTVGAHDYLRTQALARIYLDNFDNVQSSWVTQGPDIGQVALTYGANDLGSIMIEENVVSQAGTTFRMDVAEMQRLISDLGYEPRQRDNWYRLVG